MRILKTLIFHLLLTLRGFVLTTSKLLALLFVIGVLLVFFHSDFRRITPVAGKIMILTLSIFFTFINWFYDDLIFYFQPENKDITLYR